MESTSRTFGIVAALMGSLSAALLTINSFDGYDAGRVDLERRQRTNRTRAGRDEDGSKNGAIRRRDTLGFIEHITFTHHVSGTSLLVSWGLEEGSLDDFYTACCAGSFYSGVLTTIDLYFALFKRLDHPSKGVTDGKSSTLDLQSFESGFLYLGAIETYFDLSRTNFMTLRKV